MRSLINNIPNGEFRFQVYWTDDFSLQQNNQICSAFQKQFSISIKKSNSTNQQIIQSFHYYSKVILISSGFLKDKSINLIKQYQLQKKVYMLIFCRDISRNINALNNSFVKGVLNEVNDLKIKFKQLLQKINIQRKGSSPKKIQEEVLHYQLKFFDNNIRSFQKIGKIEQSFNFNYFQEISNAEYNNNNVDSIQYNCQLDFSSNIEDLIKYIPLKYKKQKQKNNSLLTLISNLKQIPEIYIQLNLYLKNRNAGYDKSLQVLLKLLALNYLSTFEYSTQGFLFKKFQNNFSLKMQAGSLIQSTEFFNVSNREQTDNSFVFIPYENYGEPSLFKPKIWTKTNIIYAPYSKFMIRKIDQSKKLIYLSEYNTNSFLKDLFRQEINKKTEMKWRQSFMKYISDERLLKQRINMMKLWISKFNLSKDWNKSSLITDLNNIQKNLSELKTDSNNLKKFRLNVRMLEELISEKEIFNTIQIKNYTGESELYQIYQYRYGNLIRKISTNQKIDNITLSEFQKILNKVYTFPIQEHAWFKFQLLKYSQKFTNQQTVSQIVNMIGQNNKYVAEIYYRIAEKLLKQKKDKEALGFFRKTIGILQYICNLNEQNLIQSYLSMGQILRKYNLIPECRIYFCKAQQIIQKTKSKIWIQKKDDLKLLIQNLSY